MAKYPQTMIPLPYPDSDYRWGEAHPLANWTSDVGYSYQEFARSNGKLASSPTIGIASPYRMPDNAGPYLPQMYPYGPYGRPATYAPAKENTSVAPSEPSKLFPGIVVEVAAKTSFLRPTKMLFFGDVMPMSQYTKPRYDLGERHGRVVAGYEISVKDAAKEALAMALQSSGEVKIYRVLRDLSLREISLDELERLSKYGERVWVNGEDVHPSVKERVKNDRPYGRALLNPASRNWRGYAEGERERLPSRDFLKPETRSWPVSDKDHAFIALQYMTRGFGDRSEYPMLLDRLARAWPPSQHPDLWAWYAEHKGQIEKMAGRSLPHIGRFNGKKVQRPLTEKSYFYMSSRKLKEHAARGDQLAVKEMARRGWVDGEPTYKIGS